MMTCSSRVDDVSCDPDEGHLFRPAVQMTLSWPLTAWYTAGSAAAAGLSMWISPRWTGPETPSSSRLHGYRTLTLEQTKGNMDK